MNRFERKKEETKNKIISVAMKLFKERGVDATSMEQIAMEVDIAKRTLYSYFPVKEAIISEFMQQSFKEKKGERILHFRKMDNTRSRMLFLFQFLIEGINENKEIFEKYIIYRMKNMVSFHQAERVKSGLNLLVLEIIELGQKENEIRQDLPIYVIEDLFEFAFIEVVKQLFTEPSDSETFETKSTMEKCIDLFMNGVSKR